MTRQRNVGSVVVRDAWERKEVETTMGTAREGELISSGEGKTFTFLDESPTEKRIVDLTCDSPAGVGHAPGSS